jgi:hypothetical protein
LLFVICYFAAAPLQAQTAAELEALLQTQAVTREQAARFVLEAAEVQGLPDAPDAGRAFAYAVETGWLPGNAQPEKPVTLAELSFLIMRAFDMKGGVMYSLAPGPRYAYRSMLIRSLIQEPADPAMTLNGDRFLLILGNVLSAAGGDR